VIRMAADDKKVSLPISPCPNNGIHAISRYIEDRISESDGADMARPPKLPGKDGIKLIEGEFEDCNALFTVSAAQTVIVSQPKSVLIGFRNILSKLWSVEKADRKRRILDGFWTLAGKISKIRRAN
jgi:hypothetical protein